MGLSSTIKNNSNQFEYTVYPTDGKLLSKGFTADQNFQIAICIHRIQKKIKYTETKQLMIDEILVQKMIEDEIHPDYTIFRYYETEPYIFIFWKHKKYDKDDERGKLIGVGPIVFDKAQKNYTILGSGSNNKHYYKHLPDKLFDEYRIINTFESIKAGIVRRKYVNTDDVDRLCQIITNGWASVDFDMHYPKDYDVETHIIAVLKNKEQQDTIINFWNEIDHQYKTLSDTEILLWKTKDE